VSAFRGIVLGVEYTDRDEFVKAARGVGFYGAQGNRRSASSWKPGTRIVFRINATRELIAGQVWCLSDDTGYVILALDDGRYAKIHVSTREGGIVNGLGVRQGISGRIATARDLETVS
jgi:hypothetical protein